MSPQSDSIGTGIRQHSQLAVHNIKGAILPALLWIVAFIVFSIPVEHWLIAGGALYGSYLVIELLCVVGMSKLFNILLKRLMSAVRNLPDDDHDLEEQLQESATNNKGGRAGLIMSIPVRLLSVGISIVGCSLILSRLDIVHLPMVLTITGTIMLIIGALLLAGIFALFRQATRILESQGADTPATDQLHLTATPQPQEPKRSTKLAWSVNTAIVVVGLTQIGGAS